MAFVPLNDTNPIDQYTSGAGQTIFPYTWLAFQESDIRVFVNDVLQTLTTDYTIDAVNQENGGNVTFVLPLVLDDKVTISRDIEVERLTGFTTAGDFRADVVNVEQNKELAISQELKRDKERTLRLADSDDFGGSLQIPSDRANKFLAFDQNGNVITTTVGATSSEIADGAITTAKLSDLAVTEPKIADGAVTLNKLGANAVDSSKIVDGSITGSDIGTGEVDTTNITDNAVTLDKLAGGSAGGLIGYDVSGDPIEIAPGTAGQVVTSNGTAVASFQDSLASRQLLSTKSAAASAFIEFTTELDPTAFRDFEVRAYNVTTDTDSDMLHLLYSINNGSSYLGGTEYIYEVETKSPVGGNSVAQSTGDSKILLNEANLGNDTGEYFTFKLELFDLDDSNTTTFASWTGSHKNNSGDNKFPIGRADSATTQTINAIRFVLALGTIQTGTFKLYGIN